MSQGNPGPLIPDVAVGAPAAVTVSTHPPSLNYENVKSTFRIDVPVLWQNFKIILVINSCVKML